MFKVKQAEKNISACLNLCVKVDFPYKSERVDALKRYIKLIFLMVIVIFQGQSYFSKSVHGATEPNNIILLVDDSYSMKTTDPRGLSVAASSMLLDTIDGDNNINIISFGDGVTSPYTLESKPTKDNLKEVLSQLKFDNKYTDLAKGLEEALNQMEKVQGKKNIIILSDGEEDIAGGLTENHKAEFNSQVKKASEMKVKLNTIALSDDADKNTLSSISIKTNGGYFYCDNPSEIFNIFDKIFGGLSGFNNFESYRTQLFNERQFKFSSYIKEIVIKVASCDNKDPLVEITQNNEDVSPEETGDVYKIYRIKNSNNSDIKIASKDEGDNLVIIQMKDEGNLLINSNVDNLTIPRNVPIDISAMIKAKGNIRGLYFEKLDDGNREIIKKTDNSFAFRFKKDKVGYYPVLLTAKDGEGNIISIKNILVNVTSDPGFFYTKPLPQKIVTDKTLRVELKKVDSSNLENTSGEVLVDYNNNSVTFPLKYVKGELYADIKLKESGQAKLTTSINGITNNESFSYYLPKENIDVKVAPSFGHFLYKIRMIIVTLLVLVLILSGLYIVGNYYFNEYVQTFSVCKEINYKMGNNFKNNILSIVLSSKSNIAYINIDSKQLFISDEASNSIGYFQLIMPKQYKFIQGLLYIAKKDKMFSVQYHELENQSITQFGETLYTPIKYEDNIKINLKRRNNSIQIVFT